MDQEYEETLLGQCQSFKRQQHQPRNLTLLTSSFLQEIRYGDEPEWP
jgi:hypothetical protein